jgi:hypothetical protein
VGRDRNGRCMGVIEASRMKGGMPEVARQRDRRKRERQHDVRTNSLLIVNSALAVQDWSSGSPTEVPVMISPVIGSPKVSMIGHRAENDRVRRVGNAVPKKSRQLKLSLGNSGFEDSAGRGALDADALLSRVRRATHTTKQRQATPRYRHQPLPSPGPATAVPEIDESLFQMERFEFPKLMQRPTKDHRDDAWDEVPRSPIGGWDTRVASRSTTPADHIHCFSKGRSDRQALVLACGDMRQALERGSGWDVRPGGWEEQDCSNARDEWVERGMNPPAGRLQTLHNLFAQGMLSFEFEMPSKWLSGGFETCVLLCSSTFSVIATMTDNNNVSAHVVFLSGRLDHFD